MVRKRLITRLILFLAVALCSVFITSCDIGSIPFITCEHEWQEANCQTPRICTLCGKTRGDPVPHSGGTATCTQRAVCSTCNTEYGDLAQHSWKEATCTAPKTCSECQLTEGNPTEHTGGVASCTQRAVCSVCNNEYGDLAQHSWKEATCTAPKTCSECQLTEGNPTEHTGGEATCLNRAVCSVCNSEYGDLGQHSWNEATCTAPKTCSECQLTEGNPIEHTGGEATCLNRAVCSECGNEYGELGEHRGGTATCLANAICDICNEEYGEIGDHSWVDATCTEPKSCSVCQLTEGDALGHTGGTATCLAKAICDVCNEEYGETGDHSWVDATCTEPKSCSVCQLTEGDALGHIGGEATCISRAVCSECGNEYGELAPDNHTNDAVWVKDYLNHREVYPCCNTYASEPSPHTKVSGVCTVCGHDKSIPSLLIAPSFSHQGSEVCVAVSIMDNPGLAGLEFRILYNESVMTLTEVRCGDAFSDMVFTSPNSLESGCKFIWDSIDGVNLNGNILVLTFSVAEDAPAGTYAVLISDVKAYDGDLEFADTMISYGSVYNTAHSGGSATCIAKAVCDECHEEYGELNASNHVESAEWTITESTHRQVYSCCGVTVVEEASHDFSGNACTVCPYQRPVPTLTVNTFNTNQPNQYIVTVTLENNPGLTCIEIMLSHDHSVMRMITVGCGELFKDMLFTHPGDVFDLENCKLLWEDIEPHYQNGVLLLYSVELQPDVDPGDYAITIQYARGYDSDIEPVTFTTNSGIITVPDAQ